jgi:heat shock protein HslJ
MRGIVAVIAVVLVAGCGAEEIGGPGTAPPLTTPVTTSRVTTSPVTTSPVTTSPPTTSPPTTSPLVDSPAGWDGSWVAVEGVVDEAPVALIGRITLTIAGSTFSGTAACNSYEYTAEITGDTIEFVDGFVTGTGCDTPLMDLEAAYLRSIGPTATLAVSGALLTLTTPSSVWTFVPVEPVADVPFVGTRWQASEIFGEFGVEHIVGMEAAFLVFGEDGTLTGSTGCRDLDGNWSDEDGRVRADVSVEGTCSGALVDVDAMLLWVLTDGFVAQIDDNHLVAGADGAGMGFFAG